MGTRISVIVLGHVDHGKSTLVGRLLFEKGLVHAEEIERYAELGARSGKATFKYAWVMDRSGEARRRGLTLDLNFADVSTRKREVHIIDAPGHRDFLRSMITGTIGADAALLVVDVQEGVMPQTEEHAQLVRLMGLERLIVALNKVDLVGYDAGRIGKAATDVRGMLEGPKLEFRDVDVIPVSAWEGENLTSRGKSMGWYKGRSLEEVLDTVEPRVAPVGGSLRLPVMQVLKIGGAGTVVLGRVERGEVAEGDEVLIVPSNKIGVVRSIEACGKRLDRAEAGETIGLALRGIRRQDVSRGDVLGPVDDPPCLVEEFEAKVVFFGDVGVVKPGWSPYVHCHTGAVPVRLEAITMRLRGDSGEAVDETGGGFLMDGDAAVVRFRPLKPLMMETGEVLPGMARFALRLGRVTVGAGSCIAIRAAEGRPPAGGAAGDGRGFSYKHVKVGKAAREKKRKKDRERRDIWGKPIRKDD